MTEHDDPVAPDDAVEEPGDGSDGLEVEADEATADTEPDSEPDDEPVDLATAIAQRDEYLALARQLQADFENFRKRAMKQQSDLAESATGRLVEGLLPALDACDSAVLHGVEGAAPLHKQLLDALTKAGLEVIGTEDVPFDPTIHEAVLHEPADPGSDDEAQGQGQGPRIVEVLRTGYLWQGRTLRAAMVKVRD